MIPNSPIISAEEWESEFDAWVADFPERPFLSDDAISRENMNPDR